MDEETIRLILEAQNNASTHVRKLTDDLKRLAEQAQRTQQMVGYVMSGGTRGSVPAGSAGSPGQQFAEAKRQARVIIKEREQAVKTIAKHEKQAQDLRHMSAILHAKKEMQEQQSAIKEAARLEKGAEDLRHMSAMLHARKEYKAALDAEKEAARRSKAAQDIRHMSAMRHARQEAAEQRKNIQIINQAGKDAVARRQQAIKQVADAEKEVNKLLKDSADEAMRLARAQDRAADHAQRMARAAAADARQSRRAALGGIGGGASDVVSGVGRMANSALRLVGHLQQAVGVAGNLASALVGGVLDVLHRVERAALIAGVAIAGITAVIIKTGTEFNRFKENNLITLDVLTESAEKARKIFDFAFELAIPAALPFEEILEGARTLEAFGLKLDGFGQSTGRYLKNAVMLAQGMQKPLAQVTRFLGNLSQGRLLLQQAAPLGMGRQTLQSYGVQFDAHGSPTDRTKLLEAAMKAIEDKWGGLLEKMAGTFESALDAMTSRARMFGGKITEGLFGSLSKSFLKIAEMFGTLLKSQNPQVVAFVKALSTPFDLLGKVIEAATAKLPGFVLWLSKIITRDKIVTFISEVIAVVRVMGDDINALVKKTSGGTGLVGIWEAFREAALNAIDSVMVAWGGFMGGLDYLLNHGPELWNVLVSGAQQLVAVVETLAGLMALSFGAQMVAAISQTASGIIGIGTAAKDAWKWVAAIRGGGAAAGAAAGASGAASAGAAAAAGGAARFGALALGGLSRALVVPAAIATTGYLGYKGWQRQFGGTADERRRRELGLPEPPTMDQVNAARAARGQKAAGGFQAANLGGIPGMIQGVGRGVIGMGAGAFGAAIPGNVKNFGRGFMDAVKGGMDNARTVSRANRAQYARDAKRDIYGMLNPSGAGGAGKPGDPNAPGHQMFGQGGAASAKMLRDPELLKQIIEAYEASFAHQDTDQRAQSRSGLGGLYREMAMGERSKLGEFAREAGRSRNSLGEVKSEDERKKDAINYWKQVEAITRVESEIAEIQKNALDATSGQMMQASEARTAALKAQLELLPESLQAAAAVERIVPELKNKQQLILKKLQATAAGTKEHYALQEESHKIERQIIDLKAKAAEDASKHAFETPKRQFSTLKKFIDLLPRGAQGAAMEKFLAPRLLQTLAGARQETDPVARQGKLLDVADMFADLQDARKSKDPFGGFFDRSAAAQRSLQLQAYQRGVMGPAGRKRSRIGASAQMFEAMSPFAPSPGSFGGGAAGPGDAFTQIILNLPANANEAQIADALERVLREKLLKSRGR